jgi:rhodanese-related sulfurtransferase
MIALLKSLFGAGGERIGPQDAVLRLNRGAVLVDVREPGEFAAGHAPGAIHLPLGDIRARAAGAVDALALPDTVQEVLLICRSGMRSRMAQDVLSKDARRRYVNVQGGMGAWVANGLPVAKGG